MEDNKLEDLENRFRKKMHYLLGLFADKSGMYPEEAKGELKTELRRLGIIQKSTLELDIKGLAKVCNLLSAWIVNWK